MKTLVIGANGQIGRQLLGMMSLANLPVRAMIRHPEQARKLTQLGAEIILADLEAPLPDEAFAGCDKVVFTAGSGSNTGADKTILIDLWAAIKTIDMAKKHQITQFVMVSARDAGDPEHGTPAIKHYNICKHFADNHLLDSGVPYTILRPGRLTNDVATGLITTQRPIQKDRQTITRADVAACILQCLQHSEGMNQVYEIYNGDMPITAAFKHAVNGHPN